MLGFPADFLGLWGCPKLREHYQYCEFRIIFFMLFWLLFHFVVKDGKFYNLGLVLKCADEGEITSWFDTKLRVKLTHKSIPD